tara:strand:- start:6153 stop:6671 length:519 start_codon:yes stop_codon:yes gene_type:complete
VQRRSNANIDFQFIITLSNYFVNSFNIVHGLLLHTVVNIENTIDNNTLDFLNEANNPQPTTQPSNVPGPAENEQVVNKAIEEGKINQYLIDDLEFNCSLSAQIITDAVYFLGQPKIKYERSQIEHWVKDKGINPFTRERVEISDLIIDEKLTKEIKDFINNEISKSHKNKPN